MPFILEDKSTLKRKVNVIILLSKHFCQYFSAKGGAERSFAP
jgi:hypothetical protein